MNLINLSAFYKLQIAAFMQGVFWPGSKVSSLNVDICSHILAQLLPNKVKVEPILHALIENGCISNAQFSTWEAKRRSILGKESSFCNFNDEGLTTQKTIEDVKQIPRV